MLATETFKSSPTDIAIHLYNGRGQCARTPIHKYLLLIHSHPLYSGKKRQRKVLV